MNDGLLLAHLKRLTGRNFSRYTPLPTPADLVAAVESYCTYLETIAEHKPQDMADHLRKTAMAYCLEAEAIRLREDGYLHSYAHFIIKYAAILDGKEKPNGVFHFLELGEHDEI